MKLGKLKLKVCQRCGAYYGDDSHVGNGICLFFQKVRRELLASSPARTSDNA
jgi:hypothetical protein